ncbi:hypothetical protein PybrP1_011045 [[Pythium] brassicae (nom. inval.)]|nr:hypothetical protein PybrP1_011045 [[Pythium] brassicae (nom. inval.)]
MAGFVGAALQAIALSALAAWLTQAFAGPLGLAWQPKDVLFVLAVAAAVFYNRTTSMRYDALLHAEISRRQQHAPELERVEFVHGRALQLEHNRVTCVLFFGTWCAKSRAALQELSRLRGAITHGGVQFVALTQESREELAMYEVKGRGASDFRELASFPFAIAIEDGHMSKGYLVKFDVCSIPQLFVVAKDLSVLWFGDVTSKGVEELIRSAVAADNVELDKPEERGQDDLISHQLVNE